MSEHGAPPAWLLLVFVAFSATSVAYGVISPPFENPDELSHAEYAAFLTERSRLPVLRDDCVRLAGEHQVPTKHVQALAMKAFLETTKRGL